MHPTASSPGSGVSTRNPEFDEFLLDWVQMRETYRGERVVKEEGFKYLPATSGMVDDGLQNTESPGYKAYQAYRARARFPDLVRESVEAMLGVMHHKPPTIELPARLEAMRDRSTLRNESLAMILRRINEEQLITGRIGLLLEVPGAVATDEGSDREGAAREGRAAPAAPITPPNQVVPIIATYHAERLINWDEFEVGKFSDLDQLNLTVINETDNERTSGFTWQEVQKYRVLTLGDPFVGAKGEEAGDVIPEGVYSAGVFSDGDQFSPTGMVTPSIAGRTLDFIPFVFANTKDVSPCPDDPPLLGLSNLALTIYRGEADYRQSLFMQGQDTLVTTGANLQEGEAVRTGAGASIDLSAEADAKYIGVDSSGLEEQRLALENDYDRGNAKASALLESVGAGAESGEALRVRVAARTASLNQVALTGAFALERLLKMAAIWVGANPDEVVVVPNLDFVSDVMPGADLAALMGAKGLGAPLSLQSIHETMQNRGLTEKTWEEELEEMGREFEEGLPGALPIGEEQAASSTADPEEDPTAEEEEEEIEAEEDAEDEQE